MRMIDINYMSSLSKSISSSVFEGLQREEKEGRANYERKRQLPWRGGQRDRRARRAASRFGSDQFRPLSALESAWTSRKCNAFMRARHYARDIMRIATRQSSSRHVHPCSPLVQFEFARASQHEGGTTNLSLSKFKAYQTLHRPSW